MTAVTVNPERLVEFATDVNIACGQSEPDARLCADSLVQADLWGHQSHGVMRLSWYAARMKAGVCDALVHLARSGDSVFSMGTAR